MKICEKKGHKFEPRYDEHPQTNFVEAKGLRSEDVRKLFIYTTYVCDICTFCGTIIGRKEDNLNE